MPQLAVEEHKEKEVIRYDEEDSYQALYDELLKGIRSVKNGEVFTIEEAWKEIDKI